jgi:hypothetical protein
MTVLVNNFEGGTSGTTLTLGNSGGASGNAFDVITIGSGATNAFDNTQAAHGTLAVKIATGASAVSSYNRWSTSIGTVTQAWVRMYLYFTAVPTAITRVMGYATSGGTTCGIIAIGTTGKIQFFNSSGSAIITTANTIPTNAWFRVEAFLLGSATVGQMQLKTFTTSMDSTTPNELLTSTATQNTAGAPGLFSFGQISNTASVGPFWMDEIGISTTGYLGPFGTPTSVNMAAFADFFM